MSSAGGGAGERQTQLSGQIQLYLQHLQIERGLAANTLSSYQRDLLRYEGYLASRGLGQPAQIDEGVVTDFLAALSTGDDGGRRLSQRSAARVLASVRGLHKYWAIEGLSPHDPAAGVSPPKARESLPKALTVEEVSALLEVPNPATALGLRDKALLEFLYGTGARITEAVSLDVDNVHGMAASGSAGESESDQLVVVRVTGKGDKQRLVPLGSYGQRAIGDYLTAGRPALAERIAGSHSTMSSRARQSSPALFLNKLGGRLSRQSAWTILKSTAEKAGVEKEVSPHTLRHSCATHMIEGGASIRLVQEMLGHASVTTTQIYTKVTADSLREIYATSHPRAL